MYNIMLSANSESFTLFQFDDFLFIHFCCCCLIAVTRTSKKLSDFHW